MTGIKPDLAIFSISLTFFEIGLFPDMKPAGGMTRKVEEALKISKIGMNVFFVNGNKPERILKAVRNRKFEGTLFRGKRNV